MKIICHPANFEYLKHHLKPYDDLHRETVMNMVHYIRPQIAGIEIVTNPDFERFKWVVPKGSKFIEYELSDMDWLVPLKIADQEPLFYIYNGKRITFRNPVLEWTIRDDKSKLFSKLVTGKLGVLPTTVFSELHTRIT
jgi:hypothetical protein